MNVFPVSVGANAALNPYGQFVARKTVTFANTSGTVNLFTVTGRVAAYFVHVCTTSLASAGGSALGVGTAEYTDSFGGPIVDVTTVDAGMSIDYSNGGFTATPNQVSLPFNTGYWLLNGQDIIATLSAQVDSGVLEFYCFWTPLSADGNVVAA